MRPRKIKLSMLVPIMGTPTPVPIAELKIVKLAEERKAETERLCPKCGARPTWKAMYDCVCGATYKTWQGLKQVVKATGEEVVKRRLAGEGDVHARLWRMSADEFSKYTDGTAEEYGVTVADQLGALNLKKLLIASKLLGEVIIVTYDDTYEQRVALLTVSEAKTVVLREIIPLNLADVKETLKVSFEGLTDVEVQEAKAFVATLPEASEETLTVDDYRTIGLEAIPVTSTKVQDLSAILARLPEAR